MKYNVGDKVKIREDLIVDEIYGCDSFTDRMAEHRGKFAKITEVKNKIYRIDLDDSKWNWTDEMFEDYTKPIVTPDTVYRTVDVGYHLDYCGHRVLEDVWQGGIASHGHVFFTTKDSKNQYTLPTDAIDFVIPHED